MGYLLAYQGTEPINFGTFGEVSPELASLSLRLHPSGKTKIETNRKLVHRGVDPVPVGENNSDTLQL